MIHPEEGLSESHSHTVGYGVSDASPLAQRLPRVVNVKVVELRQRGYRNLVEWQSVGVAAVAAVARSSSTDQPISSNQKQQHLYIGRDMSFYVEGAKRSKWANPFPVKKVGMRACLSMFEQRVRRNEDGLWDALEELVDVKEIGCWCKPGPCHGDVLRFLLHEKLLQRNQQQAQNEIDR